VDAQPIPKKQRRALINVISWRTCQSRSFDEAMMPHLIGGFMIEQHLFSLFCSPRQRERRTMAKRRMHYFNAFTIRFNDRLYRLHAFSPSVSVKFIFSPDRVSELSCSKLRAHENAERRASKTRGCDWNGKEDGKNLLKFLFAVH
jgi:hypothetical protein